MQETSNGPSRPRPGKEPPHLRRTKALELRVAELQAAVDTAHAALHAAQYVGGPTEREAWSTAWDALCPVATEHKGQDAAEVTGDG